MVTSTEVPVDDLLDLLRNSPLTEEQAREIVAWGLEAAVFAILLLSQRLAEQQAKTAAESHQTPGTPSGMKPPYGKPPGKARKKPAGAKVGHVGTRRQPPARIDRKKTHRADRCPDCGGKLVASRCEPGVLQQVEITETPTVVTEHQGLPTGARTAARSTTRRCRRRW